MTTNKKQIQVGSILAIYKNNILLRVIDNIFVKKVKLDKMKVIGIIFWHKDNGLSVYTKNKNIFPIDYYYRQLPKGIGKSWNPFRLKPGSILLFTPVVKYKPDEIKLLHNHVMYDMEKESNTFNMMRKITIQELMQLKSYKQSYLMKIEEGEG